MRILDFTVKTELLLSLELFYPLYVHIDNNKI